ncbi:MAG: [FeFe] hydrogenase H-cluster radical SAM maturase HydG [Spirochaetes bacterium]|nr:[FeFe] hydrogenase H-cluster radical SAM maturase HydG [Spirochaetota bacterium]
MPVPAAQWCSGIIKNDQIEKYLINGKDFIDEEIINKALSSNHTNDKSRVRDILQKSLEIKILTPEETAVLLNITDNDLWEEMYAAGLEVKRKVYDNRIVFFAPLYCSNVCVNGCRYCGFRSDNSSEIRKTLTMEEIREETVSLLAEGHKRMIIVFGEHPRSDIDYMCDAMNAVYSVKGVSPRNTETSIRRINVNAAPMSTEKLRKLKDVGIGTYQVFQETYHKPTYSEMHPSGPKQDYRWRLYAMHRAMDAGIDDMGIGALFGLYDWKFEVMGLLYHALDLERQFSIGPHTVSFPRLTPASGSTIPEKSGYLVTDEHFKKLVTVLRLAIPYTGLIITARERPEIRMDVMKVGCTQTDASSKIEIGGYSNSADQELKKQQFLLGDTRSLDEVTKELAQMGMITSFCTAGYRCGRTGSKIMGLLHNGIEGKFCKLNAVLTYREYLDDYASEETRALGEQVIARELSMIDEMDFYKKGNLLNNFHEYYEEIKKGKRDLFI